MSIALLALLVSVAPAEAVDTLVVCPAEFRAALEPWVAHRAAQGHRMTFVGNTLSAADIRASIRRQAEVGGLEHVVLVGDADPAAELSASLKARSLPTHLAKAKINVRFGSEEDIATDNWYADLDDDGLPDLAVGRLTADSPDELALIVRKILAYEKNASHGAWRRRVNFVAGVGGFGALIDSVVETATKKFLTEGIPSAYRTSMTFGSWRSPYCPDPRRFQQTVLDRFNEGCLFWVYIGHGQKTYLDRVNTPVGQFPILDNRDVPKLSCAEGAPIAIFLACYTGAFDQTDDCLAEEMLRREGGPVAVLSGSRVTMPYGMAIMGNELLDEYFHRRRATLGEVLMHAKRRLAAPTAKTEGTISRRQWLDMLAATFSPNSKELAEERAEHVLLFNLLGDPLLRLPHPQAVALSAAEITYSGDDLEVTGNCPLPGRLTVELVCRRDRMKRAVPGREQFEASGAALAAFDQTYNSANDQGWSKREFDSPSGTFRLQLSVPAEAVGPCHVRAYVTGSEGYALGAADVFVRRRR